MLKHGLLHIRRIRPVQTTLKRYASVNYLTSALTEVTESPSWPQPLQPPLATELSSDVVKHKTPTPHLDLDQLRRKILSPNILNDLFLPEGQLMYTPQQITKSQTFFNNAKINLDWTLGDYKEIPDVKYDRMYEARKVNLEKMAENNIRNDRHFNMNAKSTFGIKPELLRPLPEILIMGHTNVGKSSLINNLLTPSKSLSRVDQLAYVSAKAGYTKSMNCFRISNKLRFIDSPGYGKRGDLKQGEMVIEYIEHRKLLKKVLLLIDSVEGFRPEDTTIMDHLHKNGVSFDIVFTKMDEILKKHLKKDLFKKPGAEEAIKRANQAILEHYNNLIENSGLQNAVVPPKFVFNNAHVNKFIPQYSGNKMIRCSILESCNLLPTY